MPGNYYKILETDVKTIEKKAKQPFCCLKRSRFLDLENALNSLFSRVLDDSHRVFNLS